METNAGQIWVSKEVAERVTLILSNDRYLMLMREAGSKFRAGAVGSDFFRTGGWTCCTGG